MLAALAVTTLGIAISVAGLLQSDLYDIGIMVTFLGAVGIATRLAELLLQLSGAQGRTTAPARAADEDEYPHP